MDWGTGLMMKLLKKWYSVTGLLVALLLIYTISLLVYRAVFESMETQRMMNAFPNLWNVVEDTEILEQERYEDIPIRQFPHSAFIVFDEDDKSVLYASDEKILQNIYYEDLEFINDFSTNRYFNVSKIINKEQKPFYIISQEGYDEEDSMNAIYDRCVLNSQYEIIEGDLFPNRKSLNKRELNFLQGLYDKKMNVEKYSYSNKDGKKRVLVFVAPTMTEHAYHRLVEDNGKRQIYAFPIFLFIVLIQILLFRYIIKRSFLPFQKAIVRYRENANTSFDEGTIPLELRQTAREFQYTIQALEETKKERQQAQQEKYALISGISHDLKTPLTVIRGFSEALLEKKVPQEKEQKYLQTIHKRALIANDLVDSLFGYMKIEHPSYQLHLQKIDICEYTKQFFAQKYPEIVAKKFKLEIELPKQPCFGKIDVKLFDRVLENIVENSLKHNPEGTTVFVKLRQKQHKIIWTLADNGIGMKDEVRKHIFMPFVTGDESRHDSNANGLGMSIAQKIVSLHHGTIVVMEKPQNGYSTEFCIELPQDE